MRIFGKSDMEKNAEKSAITEIESNFAINKETGKKEYVKVIDL